MKSFFSKFKSNTLGGLLLNTAIAGVTLVLLCMAYFFIYLPRATNHLESITVPNIEGLPITKVQEFLSRHDLVFEVNDSTYSAKYPPLTVLKQFPAPGARVKEGRKVYVSINRVNPPTVPLPNLIDGSLINAEARLRASELKRGKIHFVRGPFLNVVREMRVDGVKVDPNVRIPKGTIVDLVVMDGGSPYFDTPNVMRYPVDEAEISLKGANLNMAFTLIGDTTNVQAIVLKQKPVPYERIRVGEIVHLWIGPPDAELPPEGNEPLDHDNGIHED